MDETLEAIKSARLGTAQKSTLFAVEAAARNIAGFPTLREIFFAASSSDYTKVRVRVADLVKSNLVTVVDRKGGASAKRYAIDLEAIRARK